MEYIGTGKRGWDSLRKGSKGWVNNLTFSEQLDNILMTLRHTDVTESAGDQSSVSIDKQI